MSVVVLLSFLLVRLLPGDPAVRIAGLNAPPGAVAEIREELRLDAPLPDQLTTYLSGLARLDFGESFTTRAPVYDELAPRLRKTAELALLGCAFLMISSLALGVAVAFATRGGRRGWLHSAFSGGTGVAGATPEIVSGLLLVAIFGLGLEWLPVAGSQGWNTLLLPAIAIAITGIAYVSRLVRAEAADVLTQDYVRAARGRGGSEAMILLRHVVPNAAVGALTVCGLAFAMLLGGTAVIEAVFNWPGIGTAMVNAIQARDYPIVQTVVVLVGFVVIAMNFAVDLALLLLDPRRRA